MLLLGRPLYAETLSTRGFLCEPLFWQDIERDILFLLGRPRPVYAPRKLARDLRAFVSGKTALKHERLFVVLPTYMHMAHVARY